MKKNNNSRRNFIRNSTIVGLGIASADKTFSITSKSKSLEDTVGHNGFTYIVDKSWSKQNVNIHPVHHCHEMVMDKKGRLFMTTTHKKNNVLVYNKDGKVLDGWSVGFNGAHGLTLSNEGGTEFLYITDPDLHRVCKTDLNGKLILEIFYPKEIRDYSSQDDFKPTETAIAPNGDIYVADGYGKDFIIKYDQKGNYLGHFGGKGSGKNHFDCCHGITIDNRFNQNPTLLISSRTKNEFKRFTLGGKHLETVSLPGYWMCRPVIKGDNLYFAIINTYNWWNYDGMIAVLDKNNKVVSLPGGGKPSYKNGVINKPVYDDRSFLNPHDVCIDDDENIYVPQWNSGRTTPLKLNRV